MNIRVVKWGTGLGLRIPKALAEDFDLHDGSELDVQVLKRTKLGKQIVIRQRKPGLNDVLDGIEQQAKPEFIEFSTVGLEVL